MKLYEKVIDLLNIRVFGHILADDEPRLFLANQDGNSYGDYRIGIYDISWYNESMWGDTLGKLLKEGSFEYKEEYSDYCEEWVNGFFGDIKLRLFKSPALAEYKNVYNYLKGIRNKKNAANKLFDFYLKEYKDLDKICPLMFNVGGEVGKEIVNAKQSEYNSPINMLENFDWVESEEISSQDGEFDKCDARNFFDRMESDMDILKLSKLFTDNDVSARKRITRFEDGTYEIVFENWNIWRDERKEWVEKMGVIKTNNFIVTSDELYITGSFEEIETMINLLHGGN